MYYYKLYGLNVASQLRIPDANSVTLPEGIHKVDITLMLDEVPDINTHETLVKLNDTWRYSVPDPQLFYMHCNGFEFEISNGSVIKVDTHKKPIEGSSLITYILGSAFGVIGMQRGLIPIHGASISNESSSVIITGYSGSGKSAILSALVHMGYRYLSDDVSMIATNGGAPFVFPSYPQRKIAAVTAAETGEDVSSAKPINEDGRDKYAIRKTSEWLDKTLPLSGIVELSPETREDNTLFLPEINEIKGHASFILVFRNQYRLRFAASIGTPPHRIKQLLEITSSVKTYQVIRPTTGFSVEETARMILGKCF